MARDPRILRGPSAFQLDRLRLPVIVGVPIVWICSIVAVVALAGSFPDDTRGLILCFGILGPIGIAYLFGYAYSFRKQHELRLGYTTLMEGPSDVDHLDSRSGELIRPRVQHAGVGGPLAGREISTGAGLTRVSTIGRPVLLMIRRPLVIIPLILSLLVLVWLTFRLTHLSDAEVGAEGVLIVFGLTMSGLVAVMVPTLFLAQRVPKADAQSLSTTFPGSQCFLVTASDSFTSSVDRLLRSVVEDVQSRPRLQSLIVLREDGLSIWARRGRFLSAYLEIPRERVLEARTQDVFDWTVMGRSVPGVVVVVESNDGTHCAISFIASPPGKSNVLSTRKSQGEVTTIIRAWAAWGGSPESAEVA